MIALLSGRLLYKSPESVVVDVGGVGYEVFIPLSTYYQLPGENGDLRLNIHTHLRDDAIQLFGFLTREELSVFQLLIGVTGVGPKLARNILSGISVDELVSSIAGGDRDRLSAIPGIGAKSAERLILELKDKVRDLAAKTAVKAGPQREKDSLSSDVVSALNNLGYRNVQAEEAVKRAKERLGPGYGFEALLKESFKGLAKRQAG